ncbi:MAG: PAS domain-containing protein [Vulcanimicrobiota bacterium]
MTWSEALYRVYGQDPATFQSSLESFLALLHPDDRDNTHQAIQRALSENSSFHHLERIIRPGGEVRVLESQAKVELDSQGQPIYLIGACLDVTERVSSAVTLRRAH